MTRKCALITGMTGMVGSHLADYLLANTDWDIVGMCRWRSPLDNISHIVPMINRKERVRLIYGDLRDSSSIDHVVKDAKPDYVFHLAAQSFPQTSFTSPLDTYETNIQGTSRVLEALRHHKKDAVIHICASEVFGRAQEKLPITGTAVFILLHLMPFRKWEQISLAVFMQKLIK